MLFSKFVSWQLETTKQLEDVRVCRIVTYRIVTHVHHLCSHLTDKAELLPRFVSKLCIFSKQPYVFFHILLDIWRVSQRLPFSS